MNIGKKGTDGERRVAEFLRKQGFAVIKRNYVCRFGEIDIIAESENYIIFVEVKTRKAEGMVLGRQAVDSFKQNRMILTANNYIAKTDCEKQPRFDIAEVIIYEKADGNSGYKLRYIENAF